MMARILMLLMIVSITTGCSSLGKTIRDFITGRDTGASRVAEGAPRFSDTENLGIDSDKRYRRMNRQRFEDEAELRAEAGSLWVMEGQGAYLFSQNQMRMVGDLLNVKIEGGPKSQLQTKVRVIARLLERIESPNRGLASQEAAPSTPDGQPQQQGAQGENSAGGQQAAAQAPTPKKDEVPFSVEVVPTRIVEQLKDGSYRVRGLQPFMIGRREYKVIVTGIVRAEDFDDAGINASKLLDPQFDIVSSRKGASL